MKKLVRIIPLVPLLPLIALAQGAGNFQGLTAFITNVMAFVNGVLVPGIFALAFIVFIWGVFKTFILGGDDEEEQKRGKQLMMYAIAGFVLMISIWGIVRILSVSFGFNERNLDPNLVPQINIPSQSSD